MKFDPKKPHGIVIGIPGAAYEQDGKLYTPTGEPHVESQQEELPLTNQGRQQPQKRGNAQ